MTKKSGPDNSGALFDSIKRKHKFKRDLQLAQLIGEYPSVISAIRNGKREISDTLLVRICGRTGMSLKTAKAKIADRG